MNPFDDLNANFDQNRLNAYMQSRQAPVAAPKATLPPKKKKSFLVDNISTVGGIIGGIGGGIAGGAAGLGIGAVPGAAVGGAAGSALGETLENILTGESLGKNVAKEAALGGVFSAGPVKLVKLGLGIPGAIASKGGGQMAGAGVSSFAGGAGKELAEEGGEQMLKTGFTGRMVNSGNRALASQYGTISRPTARAVGNPLDVIGKLADAGITKPVDAERISRAITGSHGILTKQVAAAVGKAGKVSVNGVDDVFQKSMVENGVEPGIAKTLQNQVKAQLDMMQQNNFSAPSAMTAMRNLEKRAANLMGKGQNNRLSTPERADQAQVLLNVRNEIQEQLYNAAGANKNVSKVLTPEVREQLLQLHPKSNEWARFVNQKVMNSKTIGDLRSAQSPFVNMGKIIEDGDVGAMTFGGRLGDRSISGRAIDLVEGITKDPAARFTGKAMRDIGTGEIANQNAKGLLGTATNLGAISMLSGGMKPQDDTLEGAMTQGQGMDFGPEIYPNPDYPVGMNGMQGGTDALGLRTMAPQGQMFEDGSMMSGSPYSREALMYDLQRDPQNAEDYIERYQQLEEIFSPQAEAAKPLNEGQQMRADLIRALDMSEGAIQNGSINFGPIGSRIEGLKSAFNAGDEETMNFKATVGALRGAIAKARAGTSMTPGELQMLNKYTPSDTDSEQQIRTKLQGLRQLYGYSAPTQGAGTSLEDMLMQRGAF